MRQSTKRLLSVFLAVAFIIGAFLVFTNFTRPSYEEAKRIRDEEASRSNFIDSQKDAIEKVSNLIATYQGEVELRGVVELALPLSPDIASALSQLNGLAAQHGLGPQSFSISSVSAPSGRRPSPGATSTQVRSLVKPVVPIVFRVKLVGGYENFKRFLRGLETNIRLFDTQGIQMQQAGKQNEDLFVYDIQVATYYQSH